jgi:hypothetical protein
MRVALALITALLFAPLARAQSREKPDLTALCIAALSEDKTESQQAISALRAQGPKGLEILMSTYQAAIDRHRATPTKTEPMWDRLSAALDQVAAQKDAWAAGLYWYTDLEQAKIAAKETNRPILSLRLLGTLDTELSCANSRFFRTALYPDAAVGKYLRENFILHWKSHRPVPKLTIDFGDGRTIERTITGNSVHYILTPDGRVVDVLPGLYGPAAFLRGLTDARALALSVQAGDSNAPPAYHAAHLNATRAAWNADLQKIGLIGPAPAINQSNQPGAQASQPGVKPPTALAGARISTAKYAAEIRPIVALAPDRAVLASSTDDAAWAKIAALHAADGRLDAGSRAVILSKAGNAVAANNLTMSKRIIEDPVTKLVRNFERSVAEDTVRNEYLFHTQIHEWFVKGQIPTTLDDLNEKVYAQLFLMPKSDPWLGLVPPDTYTALPADTNAAHTAK